MKEIELTQGYWTQVDDEDFEWLDQWLWHIAGKGYAARKPKHSKAIYMHRLILSAPDRMTVDHIDGDMLNNQRHNLRLATYSQQNGNSVGRGSASGVKGVQFLRPGLWCARLSIKGAERYLGSYTTIEEAAAAYKKAAVEYFGEFVLTEEGENEKAPVQAQDLDGPELGGSQSNPQQHTASIMEIK